MKTVHCDVAGTVQGVGFRDWAQREASRRGLAGWVRNRRDGYVELVLSGADESVQAMLDILWDGPRASAVTDVEVFPWKGEVGEGFRILATE